MGWGYHLIEADIVNREIKPKSVARIARIWANVQIVLKLAYVIDPTKIS